MGLSIGDFGQACVSSTLASLFVQKTSHTEEVKIKGKGKLREYARRQVLLPLLSDFC